MSVFGDGSGAFGIYLLGWGALIGLIIWFVRTLSAMAVALREIADRLGTLERAVRDNHGRHGT
jgi:hypothetical protein